MPRRRAHAKRYSGPDVVLLRQDAAPSVQAVYKAARREETGPRLVVPDCPFCHHRHIHPVAPGETSVSTGAKCNPRLMYRLTAAAP